MSNETGNRPSDALLDPEFRKQIQGLADMTAAINGTVSKPVVFSTDADSILIREKRAGELPPISGGTPKSISDDDLCSTCQHCADGPSDLSVCPKGWPGKMDQDGYVQSCAEFQQTADPA